LLIGRLAAFAGCAGAYRAFRYRIEVMYKR